MSTRLAVCAGWIIVQQKPLMLLALKESWVHAAILPHLIIM
jgi:hypothetical protein